MSYSCVCTEVAGPVDGDRTVRLRILQIEKKTVVEHDAVRRSLFYARKMTLIIVHDAFYLFSFMDGAIFLGSSGSTSSVLYILL